MTYKKNKIACVILASGNSRRFGSKKSKLFYKVHGTPIIEITLKNLTKYLNKKSIYITIPKKITKNESNLISKYTKNNLISGGKTRFDSLKNALNKIDFKKFEILMVHDAARPVVPKNVMMNLLISICKKKYNCAVPASIVEDTLRKKNTTLNRNEYTTYQTPQLFDLNYFNKKLKQIKFSPTDDLGVLEKSKDLKIKYIESSKKNLKITKKDDITLLKNILNYKVKFSSGFDIHSLIIAFYF